MGRSLVCLKVDSPSPVIFTVKFQEDLPESRRRQLVTIAAVVDPIHNKKLEKANAPYQCKADRRCVHDRTETGNDTEAD